MAKRRLFSTVAVIVLGAASFILWQGRSVYLLEQQREKVQTHWEGKSLSLRAYRGYPYIVTHLEGVTQVGADGVGQGCVARLPTPLVFIDSENLSVTEVTFNTLPWVESHGLRVPAPRLGTPVTALYFKPQSGQYTP